jgi:hypothetical protein
MSTLLMSGSRIMKQSSRNLSIRKTETKDKLSLKNKIGVKIETGCLASFRAIRNRSKTGRDSLKSLVQDRRCQIGVFTVQYAFLTQNLH